MTNSWTRWKITTKLLPPKYPLVLEVFSHCTYSFSNLLHNNTALRAQDILCDLLLKRGDAALKTFDPEAAVYDFQSLIYLAVRPPLLQYNSCPSNDIYTFCFFNNRTTQAYNQRDTIISRYAITRRPIGGK